MYNITLISTVHSESGKCNSDELYKIIEAIDPEVIFEELSNNLFDSVYNSNQPLDEFLEIKCIKKYIKHHYIKHIPVDIEPSPNLSDSDIHYMFDTFKKYDVYRILDNEQNLMTAKHGFTYINSDNCSKLFDKKKDTEKFLMEFVNNRNILLRIYKLFHDEQDNRENEMLNNIYSYSKENQYNQAVFLIGSAHRNSIIQKITKCETENKLKLNWSFYSKKKEINFVNKIILRIASWFYKFLHITPYYKTQ